MVSTRVAAVSDGWSNVKSKLVSLYLKHDKIHDKRIGEMNAFLLRLAADTLVAADRDRIGDKVSSTDRGTMERVDM